MDISINLDEARLSHYIDDAKTELLHLLTGITDNFAEETNRPYLNGFEICDEYQRIIYFA